MSEIRVNKITPRSGTDVTLGDSGDTFTLGSGANIAGLTLSDNIVFDTASKGIYLGVTTATASNLLNDYEEGTWTPVLAGGVTAGDYTYDTTRTAGTYRKIGNYVTIFGVFRVSAVNSAGSGDAFIGGIPFTAVSTTGATSYARTTGTLLKQSGYSGSDSIFVAISTGDYVNLYTQTATTITGIPVTDADFVNSMWSFQLTYKTA